MATVTRYINTNSTPGGDGTTNDTTGATRAYASFAEWNTAEATDLVLDGDTHYVYCSGGADTLVQLDAGWNMGNGTADNLQIWGYNGANGWNKGTVFDTNYYHFLFNNPTSSIDFSGHDAVYFSRIQFLVTGTTATATEILSFDGGDDSHMYWCRLRNENTAFSGNFIDYGTNRTFNDLRHCIFENPGNPGNGTAIMCDTGAQLDVVYCTITGWATGIYMNTTSVSCDINSCAVFNNTDDMNIVARGASSTTAYCATDDGDGSNAVDISPGGTEADGWNAAFIDYANGNYRIKDTDSVLYQAGGNHILGLTLDIQGKSVTNDSIGPYDTPPTITYVTGGVVLI